MRFEKAEALLSLARLLAGSAEGLTLDEMAAELRVTRRTAERMRDALAQLFPGLDEQSDGRQKRFRIANGIDAFFRAPSVDELNELQLAARALEAQGDAARAATLNSLSLKVLATLREKEKRRIAPDLEALMRGEGLIMQAGPRPRADTKDLELLREAIKAFRRCSFNYPATDGAYRRTVAPYGLLFGQNYYLLGPSGRSWVPLLWRLDRISDLRLEDHYDGPPVTFDLKAYAEQSFGAFQEEPEEVVLVFQPSVAFDAERFSFHPRQKTSTGDDGSLTVRFKAGGILELARHLFAWGPNVRILSPDRLRTLMVDELNAALEAHRQS